MYGGNNMLILIISIVLIVILCITSMSNDYSENKKIKEAIEKTDFYINPRNNKDQTKSK